MRRAFGTASSSPLPQRQHAAPRLERRWWRRSGGEPARRHDRLKAEHPVTHTRRYPDRTMSLRVKRVLAGALRRAILAYVRLPSRRQSREDGKVFILLLSAWGMGGTVRAAHNLAGYLAQRHSVEIISVYRRRQEPFFGRFHAGVGVR